MRLEDVAAKLTSPGARRGGYCFEQNVLLGAALGAFGFGVEPLLCRVRWNKAPTEETAFTHMALRVAVPGGSSAASGAFLADVGFAGTNSIAPVQLGGGVQELPEGRFRALEDVTARGYTTLQWELPGREGGGGVWRDLYAWRSGSEVASGPDLLQSNWWSCTHPTARFMTQLFVSRVIGDDERHHILNDTYCVRRRGEVGGGSGASVVEETRIEDGEHLLRLLRDVFGIDVPDPSGVSEAWAAAYQRGRR